MSIAELFTVGLGPSSSHTVGPMRAAGDFIDLARDRGRLTALRVKLHGSLALTGKGHQTDRAVILGLTGSRPDRVEPSHGAQIMADVERTGSLATPAGTFRFDPVTDMLWCNRFVKAHPNTLDLRAEFADGSSLQRRYYSIGGGSIVEAGTNPNRSNVELAYPFASGRELLEICERTGLSIAGVVAVNERAWRDSAETDAFVERIRVEMLDCIARGVAADGILPGGLGVKRRAGAMQRDLSQSMRRSDPTTVFEWVSLWALAVNEENAAGGRVVTAPTNGAAGVIPAVLKYLETYVSQGTTKAHEFLLTSAAIGFLYKKRASISAAEMGCQGEVGVACSMAAAGLAAAMGGTPRQVENAAEIGMEHNLGLTCDPIGGLVQIPCIERNTMGAIKAINAALLALRGDGTHLVSLDQVIETMRQTGIDMRSKYKETSTGGLAVNVVAC